VRVPEPLLPGRFRALAVVLLAACTAVPVVLVVRFVGHGHPGTLDSAIDPSVIDYWTYAALPYGLSGLGTLGPVTLLTLALVATCAATRRWSGAVLAAVAVPTATSLTEYVLKPHVGRPLGAGFPSGHATSMFALAAVCAVLLADPPRRRAPGVVRLLLVLMALAVATAVAVTMIAMGAHTFTDAVAGAAVGTGVALAYALTLDLVTGRGRPGPLPGGFSPNGEVRCRIWAFVYQLGLFVAHFSVVSTRRRLQWGAKGQPWLQ
jgi:undecaprenyl-diphosphatase